MKYSVNGYNYTAVTSTFPGGEEHVKIVAQLPLDPGVIKVRADIRSSQNVMQLLMLTDALRTYDANNTATFILDLVYLPYARQDRKCEKGEAFSLKVMCGLINNLKYDKVFVTDVHSYVGTALLDNVFEMTQLDAVRLGETSHNLATDCDIIIAPDAGAEKKAQSIADYYGKRLVQCLKVRQPDGRIKVTVLENVFGKKCLVVDDICDGGGTFHALADAIDTHDPASLHLFVTHGIFSKGKEALLGRYNSVGAAYDWTT